VLTDEQIRNIAKSLPVEPWGIGSRYGDALAFAHAMLAAIPVPEQARPEGTVDRSAAVNLARNLLETGNGMADYGGVTDRGVRVLCEAVMAMDAILAAAPTATDPQRPAP
jgi:hypothetical protein